jgi:hypothetical protein
MTLTGTVRMFSLHDTVDQARAGRQDEPPQPLPTA